MLVHGFLQISEGIFFVTQGHVDEREVPGRNETTLGRILESVQDLQRFASISGIGARLGQISQHNTFIAGQRTGSFELRSCLLILAGFQKNHAEIQPRRGVTGIHLHSLFALLDGEIVMPRLVGDPPYNRIDNHGQGVEFLGALDLRQRFRMAGRGHEIDAIEVMSCGVVRIELDGAAEFLFGAIPVPVVKEGRIR